MTKRQLSEKEKTIYEKQLKAKEEELAMWDLTLEVLETELNLLPKKVEISLFGKKKELAKSKMEREMVKIGIDTMQTHMKEGVEEKVKVEYKDTEVDN